ncbi:hypothetical protein R991_000268 [Salmonella enterica]|nr:hypothetical protein [Salmonella enterica]
MLSQSRQPDTNGGQNKHRKQIACQHSGGNHQPWPQSDLQYNFMAFTDSRTISGFRNHKKHLSYTICILPVDLLLFSTITANS